MTPLESPWVKSSFRRKVNSNLLLLETNFLKIFKRRAAFTPSKNVEISSEAVKEMKITNDRLTVMFYVLTHMVLTP